MLSQCFLLNLDSNFLFDLSKGLGIFGLKPGSLECYYYLSWQKKNYACLEGFWFKDTKSRIQNPVQHLRWSFTVKYFFKKPHLRCLTGLWMPHTTHLTSFYFSTIHFPFSIVDFTQVGIVWSSVTRLMGTKFQFLVLPAWALL